MPRVTLNEAVGLLTQGHTVAFPTETVYGLGADATIPEAVTRIYTTKQRPRFNPLIIHVATLESAQKLITFTPEMLKLAKAFWPGPLTLVGHKTANCSVCDLASAGLDTLGVRIPKHPMAQDLLTAIPTPLAAPSANPSGKVSPTTAQHVLESLDIPVLDGGVCPIGVESTILMCTGKVILLREGGITREDIQAIVGPLSVSTTTKITAPGQLHSHYAPNAPLRLNASYPKVGEVFLGFGPVHKSHTNLSSTGNLEEAAANLFAMLRALDGPHPIAVAPIPDVGLGRAINDRLHRAAAPRPT